MTSIPIHIIIPTSLLLDALPTSLDTPYQGKVKFMPSIPIHISILTSLLLDALPAHLGTPY